jgi:hypothetical protein
LNCPVETLLSFGTIETSVVSVPVKLKTVTVLSAIAVPRQAFPQESALFAKGVNIHAKAESGYQRRDKVLSDRFMVFIVSIRVSGVETILLIV